MKGLRTSVLRILLDEGGGNHFRSSASSCIRLSTRRVQARRTVCFRRYDARTFCIFNELVAPVQAATPLLHSNRSKRVFLIVSLFATRTDIIDDESTLSSPPCCERYGKLILNLVLSRFLIHSKFLLEHNDKKVE